MNARGTATVRWTRHVSHKNAKTPAEEFSADQMQSVMLIIIGQNAPVVPASKATHMSNASPLNAESTPTVPTMSSVTAPPRHASLSAKGRAALRGPSARPRTTGNCATAGRHCEAMATPTAPPVSCYFSWNQRDPAFIASFHFIAIETDEPECKVDSDCPPKLACIRETCQNPCKVLNPCSGNQECSVSDSYLGHPLVACLCPDGFVSTDKGYCQPGTDTYSSCMM